MIFKIYLLIFCHYPERSSYPDFYGADNIQMRLFQEKSVFIDKIENKPLTSPPPNMSDQRAVAADPKHPARCRRSKNVGVQIYFKVKMRLHQHN
jgi:hypothetical protein